MPLKGSSQDFFGRDRERWLKIAEQHIPVLKTEIKRPLHLIKISNDSQAFQNARATKIASVDSLYKTSFKKMNSVVVDFGEHLTGYCSVQLRIVQGTSDAPLRLKFTFGEVPADLTADYDSYKGLLSKGWLQDEIVNIEYVPSVITLPRRVSGRYLKIDLLGSSPWFDFAISDISFKATTSAGNPPKPLQVNASKMIKRIDSIGLNTLKECMQTVFEDGPKRDQRLWIGDFFLQSLANNHSFNQQSLTKRCLYLLAALSDSTGYLTSNVFEKPEPHAQSSAHIIDYSLLYNATLKAYVEHTGDLETGRDLWPVAYRQIELLSKYILPGGAFNYAQADKNGGSFFDWHPELEKTTATQAAFIYAAKETAALAQILNRQSERKYLLDLAKQPSFNLIKDRRDLTTGLFTSGPNKQLSYASQIWVVLSGILPQKEAKAVLTNMMSHKGTILKPVTPYLYHYYIQALINTGMNKEAKKLLELYWGSMVNFGADTFWEVNDLSNQYASPYGFPAINSYCHAWSCTPVYFIRKYPNIFK